MKLPVIEFGPLGSQVGGVCGHDASTGTDGRPGIASQRQADNGIKDRPPALLGDAPIAVDG